MPHHHKHWRKSSKNHAVSGAIWMIGLGVLFVTGWWWPGIMILIGVSSVVGALAGEWDWDGEPEPERQPKRARRVEEAAPPPSPFMPVETITRAEPAPQPQPAPIRLPEFCPRCGAPTKALRQFAAHPDECAFCGSTVRA